jgi:hypothetical protein
LGIACLTLLLLRALPQGRPRVKEVVPSRCAVNYGVSCWGVGNRYLVVCRYELLMYVGAVPVNGAHRLGFQRGCDKDGGLFVQADRFNLLLGTGYIDECVIADVAKSRWTVNNGDGILL